jgi:hypothetical protein
VVTLLLAITALWLSLSELQQWQNADAIVPVLTSLQHWTPFFWETNRYGMLVPLLARPLRNPLNNLVFQTTATIFSALASSFLLTTYLFGKRRYWLVAAALQNVWLLFLVPQVQQFDWFVIQCYGVSLVLSFASLVLVQERRMVLALALMILSAWVNSAFFILLLPLVVFYHLAIRSKAGLFRSLAVIIVAMVAGILMMAKARFRTTNSNLLPLSMWPSGWRQLFDRAHEGLASQPKLLLWILIPAALGLVVTLLSRSGRRIAAISASLIATSVCYFLAMAPFTWIKLNFYYARYLFPAILLLSTALAILAIAPFERMGAKFPRLPEVATAMVLLSAFIAYGEPSVTHLRAILDRKFGSMTNDIIASKAEVIAGNYWKVWPAVFHVNLVLYDRAEHRGIYGDTYRGVGTAKFWVTLPNFCVDTPLNDGEALSYMHDTGRQYEHERSFATIEEYCQP